MCYPHFNVFSTQKSLYAPIIPLSVPGPGGWGFQLTSALCIITIIILKQVINNNNNNNNNYDNDNDNDNNNSTTLSYFQGFMLLLFYVIMDRQVS